MPKNVLGIVYSNSYDSCLKDLTQRRTMGSMLMVADTDLLTSFFLTLLTVELQK